MNDTWVDDLFRNNLLDTLRDWDPEGEPDESRGKRWVDGVLTDEMGDSDE